MGVFCTHHFVENNFPEVDGKAEKLVRYSGMKRGVFIKPFRPGFGTVTKDWMNEGFIRVRQYSGDFTGISRQVSWGLDAIEHEC